MALHSILVKALWDAEAGVWVATSEDLPGLVSEAETPKLLQDKVHAVIQDLFEMNGPPSDEQPVEIPLYIMHEQLSKVRLRA